MILLFKEPRILISRGSVDRLVALLDGLPALGYKEASTNRIAQLHHAPVP
jgi:hypothetical protein